MVDRISSTGIGFQTMLSMQRNKQDADEFTYQLVTGFKYQNLQDYGTDMKRIQDYNHVIEEREGFNRAITLVEPITSAYKETLAHMAEIANFIMDATDPLSVKREEFPGETETMATNAMVDFEASINLEIGGRYIFAGTNYTEPPVIDIQDLDLLTVYDQKNVSDLISLGVVNTSSYVVPVLDDDGNLQFDGVTGDLIVSDPISLGQGDAIEQADIVAQINSLSPVLDASGAVQYSADGHIILQENYQSYHVRFEGDQTENARSWAQMSMMINDRQNYPYSISANEEAFQMLVDAMLRMRSAAQTFDANDAETNWELQRNMLREAYNIAEDARQKIRELEVRNGQVINQFNQAKEFHDQFIALSQTSRDALRNADQTEAALNMSTLNTQIEASYSSIAKRQELTLSRYLN